ncbi:MAG: response regulator [Bernardetiaceae bacterium]
MKGILKWSITTKLTLSYLVITAFVALMGYLEYKGLQKIESRGREMHDKHLRGLANLTRIAESYPLTLTYLRDMLLAQQPSEYDKARQSILQERDNIREWTNLLRLKLVNAEEESKFAQYQIALAEFEQQRDRFMDMIAAQDKANANTLLYGDLQQKASRLQLLVDALISLKTEDAAQAQRENSEVAETAVFRLMGMVVIAVLFSVLIAFFVYYHISLPIKILETKAHRLAEGATDLPQSGLSFRRDEIGAMTRSFDEVVKGLENLVSQAKRIANGDYDIKIALRSQDDALGRALNEMTSSLKAQYWRKDGSNRLNSLLSGHHSLQEISDQTIRFLGNFMEAGMGVIYIWDEDEQLLKLFNSYAYTEREHGQNRFRLGEGIVGQAALEQKTILLRQEAEQRITTGTTSRKALNVLCFPLIYEQELCGVIELAALRSFGDLEMQFIEEVSQNIASHIYSAKQSERIQRLFEESEQAKQAAKQEAEKAIRANKQLEEQARELQQQSEELQQQAEEMQQQSEELQQTNDTLQEQREALEKQNKTVEEARAKLEAQAKELQRASQYKSEFLANMSHELRTPLNSIILLSDMLRRNSKGALQEKEAQKAEIIYHSGNDLLNLINDILDISKIEAGRMTVNLHHFQTRELVEELNGLFEELGRQKGLYFKIEDQLQQELINDKDKIKQVLKNFLSNAFKFTKTGGVTFRISDSGRDDLPVQLSVIDTGIGIPSEKQEIIFEAFQQADGSVSREFGGTGLGLSIAREMSRLLGGEVGLESSQPGQGSTFFLLLPVRNNAIETGKLGKDVEVNYQKPSGKRQQLQSTPSAAQRSQEETDEARVRNKMPSYRPQVGRLSINDDRNSLHEKEQYILIVEDNVDYANSLAEIVREAGFKALITIQGKDALSVVEEYEPIGVLLDLGLPDMSGESILEHFKKQKHLQHIPVCIVSARDVDVSLIEKGAIDYLQKPIAAEQVKEAIRKLVGTSPDAGEEKRLLLVGDASKHPQLVAQLIGQTQIKTQAVATIAEAKAAISTGAYHALIVDIAVEQRKGLAICRYLKEQSLYLPTILYTNDDLSPEEQRELQLYTVSVIIKNDASDFKLIEKVRLFLEQMQNGKSQNKAPETPADQVINTELEELLNEDFEVEESTGSLEDVRILVVDDDVRNVFVLTSALENHDAIMFEAFNGQEALEVLEQEEVDLILMDIMMPILDGYETMRLIRLNPDLQHIPIIAVTAKVQAEDRQKCLEAGANAYLSKPIDYQELMKIIRQSLREHKKISNGV